MQFFVTPFSRAYWRTAARELKSTRMLSLAALVIALRVALKSVVIPVGESLYISVAFLPNALGSMVYGPVVALIGGAASDVLGALLFPKGPFFPPFTLVEMLGSLLFALFLYRAPLRFWRIALSKLSVNLFCNILLTPLFLAWMYGRAVVLTSLPRIAKNVLLFPWRRCCSRCSSARCSPCSGGFPLRRAGRRPSSCPPASIFCSPRCSCCPPRRFWRIIGALPHRGQMYPSPGSPHPPRRSGIPLPGSFHPPGFR